MKDMRLCFAKFAICKTSDNWLLLYIMVKQIGKKVGVLMLRWFLVLLCLLGGVMLVNTDLVMAEEMESCTCTDGKIGTRPATSILGQNAESTVGCECGGGEAVSSVLTLVIDILTIGVGILGVVGISIVGIQYLTAAGDESKVKKSKQRMFEIVIGVAMYAVMYALLKWALPSFTP